MTYKIKKPDHDAIVAVLDWLVSTGNFATGRTYELANAFIRVAILSPGRKIYFFDHNPHSRNKLQIRDVIFDEIVLHHEYGGYNFELNDEYVCCLGKIKDNK